MLPPRKDCPRGHGPDKQIRTTAGKNRCRACDALQTRDRRARKRAASGLPPTSKNRRWIRYGAHWTECIEERADGCLVWTGRIDPAGYGRRGGTHPAGALVHRQVYWDEVGPIPEGLTLDHLCRNRACVNPAHLEPVTARENLLRGDTYQGINARKTHCKNGHEFSPENTRRLPTRTGFFTRVCKTCESERSKRYYARKRAAA